MSNFENEKLPFLQRDWVRGTAEFVGVVSMTGATLVGAVAASYFAAELLDDPYAEREEIYDDPDCGLGDDEIVHDTLTVLENIRNTEFFIENQEELDSALESIDSSVSPRTLLASVESTFRARGINVTGLDEMFARDSWAYPGEDEFYKKTLRNLVYAYAFMPADYVRSTNDLRIVGRIENHDGTIAAATYYSGRVMFSFDGLGTADDAVDVLIHELMHSYEDDLGTNELVDVGRCAVGALGLEFVGYVNNNPLTYTEQKAFPTGYSRTNILEYIAESVSRGANMYYPDTETENNAQRFREYLLSKMESSGINLRDVLRIRNVLYEHEGAKESYYHPKYLADIAEWIYVSPDVSSSHLLSVMNSEQDDVLIYMQHWQTPGSQYTSLDASVVQNVVVSLRQETDAMMDRYPHLTGIISQVEADFIHSLHRYRNLN